jgi:FtsP/CotA-like multicopper oxidase with cupredoxin domain
MKIGKALKLAILAAATIGIMGEVDRGLAQSQSGAGTPSSVQTKGRLRGTTMAQRRAAAAQSSAARAAATTQGKHLTMAVPTPGGTPDYFGTYPNYANSPLGMRKFVDSLPGLGAANANNLGQYIPLAVAMTPPAGVPNDGNYYEIAVTEFTQQMHSDLPATTRFRGYIDLAPGADGRAHYLGPLIVAHRDVPVRVKFTNMIPANSSFFLPVDNTIMGAGLGPLGAAGGNFSNNRATLHLHGGDTPWISDGTPHQWVAPVGETTSYPRGVSTQNVPDMPDPGAGAMTFYYPNTLSSRLLFYHDHVSGLTRLNVYAGEAAGYLIVDDTEESLINTGVLPNAGGNYRYGIPLIIQDKTFVPQPAQLAAQDPTWNWGPYGNLWFPHVYMPNQNPFNDEGANGMGRWDYGPWFWPPYTGLVHGPVPNPYYNGGLNGEPPMIPGTPNPTIVPEAFMDTPLVNGTAYPYVTVAQQAYRFRILNACNDRTISVGLYYADPAIPAGAPGFGTEIKMVPAVTTPGFPDYWPIDNRDGGVPDPATVGPPIIQIGTEGGFLPAPVVIPSTPVNYNYNRRDIVVLNVSTHGLMLGPAERADVIVDFSQVPAGSKLILYNDAPAPVPASDARLDYYTGDPDQTSTGGAPTTLPGFGPNTRTLMQFRIVAGGGNAYNLAALETALPAAFAASQPAPLVPEPEYGPAYNTAYQTNYVRIQDTSFTFAPNASAVPTTIDMKSKAIQELFETDYGRMNATLGVELPLTNFTNQTTIPYYYIDPPSEILKKDETQIWKVTHNGVDTHTIHFHLFNVQLINRVGWDGAIRPPEANELGWKEVVRMNPLEDAIVALRPVTPSAPFTVPDSIRPLNPAAAIGSQMGFFNVDPAGNPAQVTNVMTNFGWEYVWHCHLLGHEENDMMRPMIFGNTPGAPTALTAVSAGLPPVAALHWTDNSTNETQFTIQRSDTDAFPPAGITTFVANANTTSFNDTSIVAGAGYFYRVFATDVVGNVLQPGAYLNRNIDSAPSNVRAIGGSAFTVNPVTLKFMGQRGFSATQTVTVGNIGTGIMNWTVASDQPWLTVTPPSGTDAGLLNVQVNSTGLLPGTYSGNVTLTSAGTLNSPKAVPVSLVIYASKSDFNGDGSDDILWRHSATGENYVWFMGLTLPVALPQLPKSGGQASSGQENLFEGTPPDSLSGFPAHDAGSNASPRLGAVGKADAAPKFRNPSEGLTALQSMVRTGSAFLLSVADLNWKIVGIGDFNADGMADILWRNSVSGENYVWYMNGVTRTTGVSLTTVTDLNWQIAGVADIDGDGKSDILWRNAATGENYAWIMNGVTRSTAGYLATVADLNWTIVGTGDMNGDRMADVVWRNTMTGENYVWYMNGLAANPTGEFLLTVTDLDWQIVGLGVFNSTVQTDIIWRNAVTGENLVWHMNGATRLSGEYITPVADLRWKIVNR